MQFSAMRVAGLRQHRLFSSADLDETRERVTKILQPHRLIGQAAAGRRRRAHMDVIQLPALSISAVYYGDVELDVPEVDAFYVITSLSGGAEMRRSGQRCQIDQAQAITCQPGDRLEGRVGAACEQLIIRFERTAVSDPFEPQSVFSPLSVELSAPRLGPWCLLLQNLISDPQMSALLIENPLLATSYQELLLGFFTDGQNQRASPEPKIAPALLRRAEEFIRANAAEPLTLTDIAQSVGAPSRSIHDVFRRFREQSPMAYVREMRLDLVRKQLELGDPDVEIAATAYRSASLILDALTIPI